jgi:hypothetical protein
MASSGVMSKSLVNVILLQLSLELPYAAISWKEVGLSTGYIYSYVRSQ